MKSFKMVESFSVCFCSSADLEIHLVFISFCQQYFAMKKWTMNGLIMISIIKNRTSFVGCGDCLSKWTVQSCLSLCWNLLQWFIWCPDWDYLSTILCGISLWCLQNTYGVVNSTFEELVVLCLTAQVLNGCTLVTKYLPSQQWRLCTQETDYLCQVFVARRFLAIC